MSRRKALPPIGEINGEITTLRDMPLSLNDYCSFIPEYIGAIRAGKNISHSKLAPFNGSGSEGTPNAGVIWENENGDISGLFRLVGLSRNVPWLMSG